MLFFSVVPAFSAWTPTAIDYGAKGVATKSNCEALAIYLTTLKDETFKKPITNFTAKWTAPVLVEIPNTDPKQYVEKPSFCQVVGWIWPEMKFEVTMPTFWNERYYMRGGGGWHGNLNLPTTADAPFSGNGGNAPIGYAESQSNGGFMGSFWPVDKATPGAQPGQGTFGLKEPYFTEYYNPTANTDPYPRVPLFADKEKTIPFTDFYGTRSSFAGRGNPNACQKVVDWGHRFLFETPVIAKKIINKYYGISPKKTYYWGTSCGGKEGQIAAQKYPELYDGYFIGYPLGGHLAVTFRGTWDTYWGADLAKSVTGGGTVYSRYKAALHYKTVYDKCDPVDGLVDGMIDDPTKCKFDAMKDLPACNTAEEANEGIGGVYSSTCFTSDQRKAIAEIYAGPHDSRGKAWYPGQSLSAEYIANNPNASIQPSLSSGFGAAIADGMAVPMFPNIALDPPEGPYFDITKIDWNRMPREMQRTTCEQCYDNGRCETFNIHDTVDGITISPSPTFNMGGLKTVYKKGAKIVQTHGWSDALVTPLAASKELYENTLQTMGVDRTKSFWKLYLVPGAGHGGGGLSTWLLNWDAFNAMVDWVENDVEPGAIIGSRAENVDLNFPAGRKRPNCPYPEVARWDGTGSIDVADSFTCVPPIELKVEPDALNLNRHGLFTAFITVPEGYRMSDWRLKDVRLAGAQAKSGFAVGNKYIATFRTQDLQNVQAGRSVELTVTGSFNRTAKKALVQASDTVRIFEHHAQH
jgi:hypothetical protein